MFFVNMDKVIEVSHVSKHYGKVEALHDVSFSVHKGEVFGLIGSRRCWQDHAFPHPSHAAAA